jgi:hypothetical protein
VQPSIGLDADHMSFLSADDGLVAGTETATGDLDVFLRRVPDQAPEAYCMPSTSAAPYSCTPTVSVSGTPSESSSSPFTITYSGLRGWMQGQFFYSIIGPNNAPISGQANNGYLCAATPTVRVWPALNTGGTPFTCTGALTVDFNASAIQNANHPWLTAGTRVWVQAYTRDGGSNEVFTQAVSFVIQP